MPGAANDLGFGLGDMLSQQREDETEEERKRRLMGLSPLAKSSATAQSLFGFGQTGVGPIAPLQLGLKSGRR
jgi:hypothetical protein